MEYHKIQTVYKREPNGALMIGKWSLDAFGYLQNCDWVGTEKVDGTNIRVIWNRGVGVVFSGKTDRAQLYPPLVEKLQQLFPCDKLDAGIATDKANSLILYGEGYGARIQKGGGKYIPDGVDFVLFDVRVGDWWLSWSDVDDIANALDIRRVPVVCRSKLGEAIDYARVGIVSQWGDFPAEGLVLKPEVELQTRSGHRIITKIKTRDFAIKGE